MYTSIRSFCCQKNILNAIIFHLKSLASVKRREVKIVIEGTLPTCRFWILTNHSTFKYLANGVTETSLEMAMLPLAEVIINNRGYPGCGVYQVTKMN